MKGFTILFHFIRSNYGEFYQKEKHVKYVWSALRTSSLAKTAELMWDQQAWCLLRAIGLFNIPANIKKSSYRLSGEDLEHMTILLRYFDVAVGLRSCTM